jgi:hypothetical protein
MSRSLQIIQLEQKIERLTAQLEYLKKIEDIKERQSKVTDNKKETE